MKCNISNNEMNVRHKKAHQDLPRFNYNPWSTSSPQDLLEVFFHYVMFQLQVGADCQSAQLNFTQELLLSFLIRQVVLSKVHSNLEVFFFYNRTIKLSLTSVYKLYKCITKSLQRVDKNRIPITLEDKRDVAEKI